jgi:hypothetical protein
VADKGNKYGLGNSMINCREEMVSRVGRLITWHSVSIRVHLAGRDF